MVLIQVTTGTLITRSTTEVVPVCTSTVIVSVLIVGRRGLRLPLPGLAPDSSTTSPAAVRLRLPAVIRRPLPCTYRSLFVLVAVMPKLPPPVGALAARVRTVPSRVSSLLLAVKATCRWALISPLRYRLAPLRLRASAAIRLAAAALPTCPSSSRAAPAVALKLALAPQVRSRASLRRARSVPELRLRLFWAWMSANTKALLAPVMLRAPVVERRVPVLSLLLWPIVPSSRNTPLALRLMLPLPAAAEVVIWRLPLSMMAPLSRTGAPPRTPVLTLAPLASTRTPLLLTRYPWLLIRRLFSSSR